MTIESIHRAIYRRWDEISQSRFRTLTDVEVDAYINDAIFEYVEIFAGGKNNRGYEIGIEVNRPMLDRIDTLLVGYPEDTGISPESVEDGVYIFDLSTLKYPFRSLLTATAEIACGTLSITIEQNGDFNKVMGNKYRKPSLGWRRAPAFRRQEKLYVHTDNLFEISNLRCYYVRKPAEVCLGTYTVEPTIEIPNPAAIKPKQECDLPEDYHLLLVDMVIQDLSRIYLDANRKNLLTEKISNL